MLFETLLTLYTYFRESALPNFAVESQLFFHPIRKTAFDELHCLLNRNIAVDTDEQVNVIWHDDEIVNLKTPRRHARTQHINKEPGEAIRLQQRSSHACVRGHEECAMILRNRLGI